MRSAVFSIYLILCCIYLSNAVNLRLVPNGRQPVECVFEVPSGSHIERRHDGDVVTFPNATTIFLPMCNVTRSMESSLPNNYDGWMAFTSYQHTQTFTTFLGNFSIPAKPANDPQVLYLFTALQNIDWIPKVDPEPTLPFDIIQPVLQYPGDLGNYWSAHSWIVSINGGNTFRSQEEVRFEPGENIFGNMTKTGTFKWYIGSENPNTKANTFLTVSGARLGVQPWAYTTAECYGCTGCSTYPSNDEIFTAMTLTDEHGPVEPAWEGFVTPNPLCGEAVHIISPSQTRLSFQKL